MTNLNKEIAEMVAKYDLNEIEKELSKVREDKRIKEEEAKAAEAKKKAERIENARKFALSAIFAFLDAIEYPMEKGSDEEKSFQVLLDEMFDTIILAAEIEKKLAGTKPRAAQKQVDERKTSSNKSSKKSTSSFEDLIKAFLS